MVLLSGIAAVVLGIVPSRQAGVLNPAVALGIGSFSLAYVWGPIVGAILGALLFRTLAGEASA